MNLQYLRKRPFLVIDIYHRPARTVKTERAGWHTKADNWSNYENPYVVDRVSDKMMARASVIIDLTQDKLVKNRFSENADNDVLDHYRRKYSRQIAESMGIWTNRVANRAAA